ncbi:MAG: Ig-like domain repeat protein [Acidimicrobiales bacterium]|nr:Ig-like domain repeat protein [Acidimicrobiales bacterium]
MTRYWLGAAVLAVAAGSLALVAPSEAQAQLQALVPDIIHSNLSTQVNEGGDPDSFTYTLSDLSSGCRRLEALAGSGLLLRNVTGPPEFGRRFSFWACENANTHSFEVRAVDDRWDVPGIWRQPGNTGDTYSSQVRIYEVDAGSNGFPTVASVSVPVTIVDNDPPMVNLSGGAAVTEGSAASFTITATSPPSGALTVRYRVRQNDPYVIFPGDFVADAELGVKTVQLHAGALSATFEVPTVGDSLDEADGLVRVTLESGSGYTLVAPAYQEVAVVDDDPAVLTLDDPGFVFEGRNAVFKVRSTSPGKGGMTVNFEASETGNFFSNSVLGSRSVRFPDGSRTGVISIPTVDDSLWDPKGQLTVVLRPGTGYVLGTPSEATIGTFDLASDYGRDNDPVTKSSDPDTPGGDGDPVDIGEQVDQEDSDTADDGDDSASEPDDGEESSPVVFGGDDVSAAECESADALAAEARANHDALANTSRNRKERNDWWRAWIALSGKTGTYNTPLTAAEARLLESGDARWTPFRKALECQEGDPRPTPEVSVTAGNSVTEGGGATFTVTASPAPTQPLTVDVTVAQDGDFGASTGSQTVTVPTGGTATFTVATSDDDVDESDGSISVTVDSGDGYTVSSTAGSASVIVADDDDAPAVQCATAASLAAQARANHDALRNTWWNRRERNDWWRAWIALSGKTGTYNTPLTAAEALVLESGDTRWTPFRQALECVEGAPAQP